LTLKEFKEEIDEIRVEGHTSNGWGTANQRQSYLYNMNLSQRRASNVLELCYNIQDDIVDKNILWLQSNLRANGMSFSKLLYKDNAKTIQDKSRSRRVEFRVVTKEHKKG
jgi:outer membrane protein OmpA-like peptidoglycan-associated protein